MAARKASSTTGCCESHIGKALMHQAAPGRPHQGHTGTVSRSFAQTKRQPSAEPNSKERDEGGCSMDLHLSSRFFHILGSIQSEAAAGHLTTLKHKCCSQHGCCPTATQPLVLSPRLELQELDGSCVAGRTVGLLLALPSCPRISCAHGSALCSATGRAGILPEPPVPTGIRS